MEGDPPRSRGGGIALPIMPCQYMHLSLKGPFVCVGDQVLAHGIRTNVFPLLMVAVAAPQLPVPDIGLPEGALFLSRP